MDFSCLRAVVLTSSKWPHRRDLGLSRTSAVWAPCALFGQSRTSAVCFTYARCAAPSSGWVWLEECLASPGSDTGSPLHGEQVDQTNEQPAVRRPRRHCSRDSNVIRLLISWHVADGLAVAAVERHRSRYLDSGVSCVPRACLTRTKGTLRVGDALAC